MTKTTKCTSTLYASGLTCRVCGETIYPTKDDPAHLTDDGNHHGRCCGKPTPAPRAEAFLLASDEKAEAAK